MELTEQQILEQHYFELFAQDYPMPAGKIEYSDKPDVLVRGERNLGVEIAHIYKTDGKDANSEQRQSVIRREVIEHAERRYLLYGGRKIEFSIDFNPKYPIRRKNINKMAENLAVIAQEISSTQHGHSSYKTFENAPEIRSLYHDGKEYPNSNWRHQQVFDIPVLSVARVKELVAQKVEKLRNYQQCDVYWLLLIVEFGDPSQDQDINWPAGESIGQTPFERILIYKPAYRQVVEAT